MARTSSRAGREFRRADSLDIYLNDHLLGATSGSALARRVAAQHAESRAGRPLALLATQIAEDRAALLDIMSDLDIPVRHYKIFAGWILEKAGRAKPNGFLIRRSALSTLLELETLRLGVEGKALMWHSLRALTRHQGRLEPERLADLIKRAEHQADTLEELRVRAATSVLVTR